MKTRTPISDYYQYKEKMKNLANAKNAQERSVKARQEEAKKFSSR